MPTRHGTYAVASKYLELHSAVFLVGYKGALFQPYGASSPSAFFDNCVEVTISNGNVDHGTKHVAIIVDSGS
jgi:Mlc titration factor MtfA (ptsG expression regulator)